jgi:uncharacterized protein YukE
MSDRLGFDVKVSQDVQADFLQVATQLQGLLDAHDADVRAAMFDYEATGVSDEYEALELKWKNAASEVRLVIDQIRRSLEESDEIAKTTLSRAQTAVNQAR